MFHAAGSRADTSSSRGFGAMIGDWNLGLDGRHISVPYLGRPEVLGKGREEGHSAASSRLKTNPHVVKKDIPYSHHLPFPLAVQPRGKQRADSPPNPSMFSVSLVLKAWTGGGISHRTVGRLFLFPGPPRGACLSAVVHVVFSFFLASCREL